MTSTDQKVRYWGFGRSRTLIRPRWTGKASWIAHCPECLTEEQLRAVQRWADLVGQVDALLERTLPPSS